MCCAAVDSVGECTGHCCKPQQQRLSAGPSSPDSILPYAYPGAQLSPYLHSLPPHILAQLHPGQWFNPGSPNGPVRIVPTFLRSPRRWQIAVLHFTAFNRSISAVHSSELDVHLSENLTTPFSEKEELEFLLFTWRSVT